MNIGPVSAARLATVERLKLEMLSVMPVERVSKNVGAFTDKVSMSDFGRLLSALQEKGNPAAEALVGNIMSGKPDGSLSDFLLAYCAAYGYPLLAQPTYDRRGYAVYDEEYRSLRQYFSTFSDYFDDIPGEDEWPSGLLKAIKKALRKLKGLFSDEKERPEKKK